MNSRPSQVPALFIGVREQGIIQAGPLPLQTLRGYGQDSRHRSFRDQARRAFRSPFTVERIRSRTVEEGTAVDGRVPVPERVSVPGTGRQREGTRSSSRSIRIDASARFATVAGRSSKET